MADSEKFSFKYCSYDSYYSASGESFRKPLISAHRACYGEAMRCMEDGKKFLNHYNIYIRKKPVHSLNNYCFLEEANVKNWLDYIQSYIHSFVYTIDNIETRDAENNLVPTYLLSVDIKGPRVQHLFVLTCIRYLYEFPYNAILKDAYYLHDNKQPDIELFNAIIIISTSLRHALSVGIGHGFTDLGMSPKKDTILMDNYQLRERFALLNDGKICNVLSFFYNEDRSESFTYPEARRYDNFISKLFTFLDGKSENGISLYEPSYWETNKEERAQIYLKNYNAFKTTHYAD